jgi:predicted aminopeptidase
MTKVAHNGEPYGGAQVAAYLGAQSVLQRLNAVVPGRWRREAASAAAIWLGAWSDVVRLCDLTGIDSIREFDNRFSMYQSLFNWSQDLEDALLNAGREDPELLRARIAVCEEALRRFPDEDELIVENRRRAVAESYFELGETD